MISLIQLLKEVQGQPKAIILAGAPGAGKGYVLKGLDLGGLKIMNVDNIYVNLLKKANVSLDLKNATPAQILERILNDSWTLQPDDKDMIVMQHLFGYELNGKKRQIVSSMVCTGDNQVYTAMAKTVGLPVAIATLKILNGEITSPGVQIPILKEIYDPILKELAENGIVFTEKEVPYLGYNPEVITG